MGTTLNMGSNDISNAKIVDTQTLNASADVNTARLTATQSIQSNGTINANGSITSSSDIAAQGNITANNDVLVNGTLRGAHDAVIGGVVKLQQINTVGTNCDTWGAISRDVTGATLSCQSGVWSMLGKKSLERMTWTVGSGNNYGDACLSSLNSKGLAAQGWVATGSDACTEDNQTCTVDNVRCFAVRLN